MTLAELTILSTGIHTQLYDHWGVFISLHLALFGGLFAFDVDVRTSFKVSFLLFYLLFAGINLGISMNLLNQINAIHYDIAALNPLAPQQGHFEMYLVDKDLSYSKPILIVTHVITGALVFLGVVVPSTKRSKSN